MTSNNNSIWAIVPAAGTGSRMQADRPKQYLLLDNMAVLQHTLQRLAVHPRIAGVVIAITESDPWWPELNLELACPLLVAPGGNERADSVLNALTTLHRHTDDNPWVMVHDAARPCLRSADLDLMLSQLEQDEVGGILGIPVTDTVKRVDSEGVITETVCREGLWRAATPQMFRLQTLMNALEQAKQKGLQVTDEASAIEAIGLRPRMVEGHGDNIKITVPRDLALASLYMQQQREEEQQ